MPFTQLIDAATTVEADKKIETLEQQARDLARSVETVRRQTLAQTNERIEALEQKARDLAWFVETTRQQTLLQSDSKTEALEQKARDLADFVETLQSQTRLQSDTEIEALGKKARDLALSVESVRKEARLQSETEIAALGQKARDMALSVESVRNQARLQSETEIAALGQKARDLAVSVEAVREQALLQSDGEIAALGQKARDLAVSVENVRERTLLESDTEIAALGQKARDLAVSVESVREKTLLETDTEIAALGQQARDLAISVEIVREETLLHSDMEIKELKQEARILARSVEKSRIETLLQSEKVTRKLNEDLEQRVLARTAQLEAANKELESFSYSVSHDLRAPLRAIDGFSRILLEDYAAAVPEEGQVYLRLVRDNTRQMGQLVDDLLAFSRLGRLGLTKQTVQPGKIVRLCLAEMKKEQENRKLEIVIGDLPSCQADPTLLKQVWTNLLSNALKYTLKRPEARIEIGYRSQPCPLNNGLITGSSAPGMETVYFVKDNGAGFDMKYAHKLFGVFQRLHRSADYDGTGVGLAIVQRIIFRHGGRVWGEAQVNQGATFSFTLE
jgi:signal transduction histidine kinase